jgi:chemotaxis protein CheD
LTRPVPGGVPPKPRALRGFHEVKRFWDAVTGFWTAQVLPGEFYATMSDEIITTVLGSCVSACIRDAEVGVGGINHFMLPADVDRGPVAMRAASPRYGQFALERLINALVKHGGRRERFEVKVFGGGRMLAGMNDVGRSNIDFVHHFLATEGLTITSEDVGGSFARRLRYRPLTGRALIRRVQARESTLVVAKEDELRRALARGAFTVPPPELF